MGQWKDLPYEVVQRIAQELEECDGGWMFVNKQLHDMHLSIIYQDVSIRLDQGSDATFNAIINSPFKPGLKVKELYVKDFATLAAANMTNVDKTVDLMYLLMEHCPYVKSFSFSRSWKEEEHARNWIYFLAVIVEYEKWNLKRIPTILPIMSNRFPLTYYNCAFYMRNSLTRLELFQGVLGRRDFYRLGDFQQLEEIIIGPNIPSDLYDCESILVHLPESFTNFTVVSFRMNDKKISDNINSNNSSLMNVYVWITWILIKPALMIDVSALFSRVAFQK